MRIHDEQHRMKMMSGRDKSAYVIQTVDNALYILEAISEEAGDFGVSHLSTKLGMSKSYIFRMLATFEQRGYVRKVERSGRYRAGLSAFEISGRFLHQMVLLQKAKPIMESLAKVSREAIYLAISGGNDLLFIEMVDSPQPVRVMPLVGKRFALQQFSAGKVILAQTTGRDKPSFSRQPIPETEACVDHGAVGEGIASLSVPILNGQGVVCASLCLLAPEFRMNPDQIEKDLLPLLKNSGEELSAKLGYLNAELWQRCG
jgi:IclR family transcriptional regulator, KDG regulon repressor